MRFSQFLKQCGKSMFVDFLLSNHNHGLVKAIIGKPNKKTVNVKKRHGSNQSRSLISIHKWLVLSDMKRISRGHFKKCPCEGTHRHKMLAERLLPIPTSFRP